MIRREGSSLLPLMLLPIIRRIGREKHDGFDSTHRKRLEDRHRRIHTHAYWATARADGFGRAGIDENNHMACAFTNRRTKGLDYVGW